MPPVLDIIELIPTATGGKIDWANSASLIAQHDEFKSIYVQFHESVGKYLIARCTEKHTWTESPLAVEEAIESIAAKGCLCFGRVPITLTADATVMAVKFVLDKLAARDKAKSSPLQAEVTGVMFANGFYDAANETFVDISSELDAHMILESRRLKKTMYDADVKTLDALSEKAPHFKHWWNTSVNLPWGGEDMIEFLHYIGLTLVGKGFTHGQCGYIMTGEGGTGKSVFVKALDIAFGDNVGCVDIAKFTVSGSNEQLKQAAKYLFLRQSDIAASICNSSTLRELLAGDFCSVRRPRKPPFSFQPQGGYIGCANTLPKFRGSPMAAVALWQRLRVVHLTGKSRWNTSLDDSAFGEKLAKDMGAVFSYALALTAFRRKKGNMLVQVTQHQIDYLAATCGVNAKTGHKLTATSNFR